LQEFKDYLYLAIKTLLEDFKSKSEIMVRWWANTIKIYIYATTKVLAIKSKVQIPVYLTTHTNNFSLTLLT
jgi:hypothetical protein